MRSPPGLKFLKKKKQFSRREKLQKNGKNSRVLFLFVLSLFFFFKTAAVLNCQQLLLKGVNLVCGEKNHCPVVSIHLQCKKQKHMGKTWFLHFCRGFYLSDNLESRRKKMIFWKKSGQSWTVLNFASQSLCLVKMFCSSRQENKNSRRQMPKLGWFVFKIMKPK